MAAFITNEDRATRARETKRLERPVATLNCIAVQHKIVRQAELSAMKPTQVLSCRSHCSGVHLAETTDIPHKCCKNDVALDSYTTGTSSSFTMVLLPVVLVLFYSGQYTTITTVIHLVWTARRLHRHWNVQNRSQSIHTGPTISFGISRRR